MGSDETVSNRHQLRMDVVGRTLRYRSRFDAILELLTKVEKEFGTMDAPIPDLIAVAVEEEHRQAVIDAMLKMGGMAKLVRGAAMTAVSKVMDDAGKDLHFIDEQRGHIHIWTMKTHMDGCHWYRSVFVCQECQASLQTYDERNFNSEIDPYSALHARTDEDDPDGVCARCVELMAGAKDTHLEEIFGRDDPRPPDEQLKEMMDAARGDAGTG